MNEKKINEIAEQIVDNLWGRSGFDSLLDEIDNDTLCDIHEDIKTIIRENVE